MCREICYGTGAGICDGPPSTSSSYKYEYLQDDLQLLCVVLCLTKNTNNLQGDRLLPSFHLAIFSLCCCFFTPPLHVPQKILFLSLHENVYSEYSMKSPQCQGNSNQYQQNMILWRKKKKKKKKKRTYLRSIKYIELKCLADLLN